ncbi:hypothetical protein DI383_05980 [Flavobacteriaceae bacterium LYZ1037]|nr:hypothetical protein DI383_05980 [Flavobacteriaceae bacterium LYZ1037]
MDKNKTGKYLKYAIGEIILVVIGILIALQVNNWNTKRKSDNDALKLMSRILVESEQNQEELKIRIQVVNSLLNSAENLIILFNDEYTNNNIRTVDSLIYDLLYTPRFNYKSSTLDEALSSGIVSLIQSDSLRDQLYQVPNAFNNVLFFEKLILDDYKNNLMPYLYDNISLRQIDGTFAAIKNRLGKSNLSKVDNRIVLSDVKFEGMVDNKMYDFNSVLESYDAFSKLNTSNISLLENEIKELNKN